MKLKFAVLALALGCSTQIVHAADVTSPASFDWSGFYLGATVGGQFTTGTMDMNDTADGNVFFTDDLSSNSFIGGVLAGYNHQIGNAVIGIEGDINWTDAEATAVSGSPDLSLTDYQTDNKLSESFNAHIRARAGYAMDRALIFASAGLAITNSELAIDSVCFEDFYSNDADSQTRFGLSISGGAEYAFNDHVLGRLEYVADFYGDSSFDEQGYYAERDINSFTQQTVRVGISYLFR